MTNEEIIEALPHLEKMQEELVELKRTITELDKQRDQLDRKIKRLNYVTDVIDGVALTITKPTNGFRSYSVHRAAHDKDSRRAEVYINAHTEKDYGIQLYRSNDRDREEWLNVGWPYDEAVQVANRWVTHGECPSLEIQNMIRTRHKIDPERRASEDSHLAFEAAWIAGNRALASEILEAAVESERQKRHVRSHPDHWLSEYPHIKQE